MSRRALCNAALPDALVQATAFARAAGGVIQMPLKIQEEPIADDSIEKPVRLTPPPEAQAVEEKAAQESNGQGPAAARFMAAPAQRGGREASHR